MSASAMRARRPLPRWAAAAACAAVAVAACRSATTTPPTPAGRPGPWLVTIVVDQLSAWMAAERWPALPASGGFARLRREGLYVRELRFAHATTDTAPGHVALFSGATPRASGIVANEVLEAAGGSKAKKASILKDAATRLVVAGRSQTTERPGSSLAALRVDTLADALQAARPDARVMSFSLKDRATLPAAGRHPTLALWLEPELDAFVTSTAFAQRLPDWVAPLADAAAVGRARTQPWVPLAPDVVAARAETPDRQPGEGDYDGLGVTFPHRAPSTKTERATPAGDQLVVALGVAGATAARADGAGRPLLLALSLSSHDYVMHVFGPHSWEAWDELLRLDAALADLLAALDRLVGPDGYAVMLTGDHGASALPELASTGGGAPWCRNGAPDPWQRPCGPGHRLQAAEVVAALEASARQALGAPAGAGTAGTASAWIAGLVEPLVYLGPAGRALPPAARARLVAAGAATLRAQFGVADLVDMRSGPEACADGRDESVAALVCRSLRADGPGDLYVVPRPGTFFDPGLVPGFGTSHGSPYLYDRAVPLLVRAPGRVAPGVRQEPVPVTAFAATAAGLLGVPPPAAARGGQVLTGP